jgi:hypothetical protein
MGSGAKSYMRKDFLKYEEMHKFFTIYKEAVIVIYDFAPDPSDFPYMWGKFYFRFYQRRCNEDGTYSYIGTLSFFKPPKCSFCHSSHTQKPQVHGERLIRGVTPVTDTVQSCKWGFQRTGQNIPPLGGLYFLFIKQFLTFDRPWTW